MKYELKTVFDENFFKNKNLVIEKIMRLFQEVASHHANELGLGFDNMIKKNLYWVLLRVKFDIELLPKRNQIILVETWPHEKGRIDFDRDFLIKDEDGNVLIKATSKWCVIDSIKRMIQRTDQIEYNGEYLNHKNYNDKFDKIMYEENDNYKYLGNYRVKNDDIDENGHMNNANYARVALILLDNHNYTHFEINFIKECMFDDVIEIYSFNNQGKRYILGKVDEAISFVIYIE